MDKLKPEELKALNDRISNVMRQMTGIPASAGVCEPIEGFEALPEHAVYCMRDMAAELTAANARIAYFEQLAADRLVQMTADAERIAELEETLVSLVQGDGCLMEDAYKEGWEDAGSPYDFEHAEESWTESHAAGDARRAAALLEKK